MTSEFDEDPRFEFTEDAPSLPGAKPKDPETILRRKVERVDLEKLLSRVLESRIAEAVDALISERIQREVDEIFEQGWVATNQWGEPERDHAPRIGIKDRIAAQLSKKQDYGRGSKLENILHKAVEKAVTSAVETESREFKKELKAWRNEKMAAKLRAVLDGDIFS